MGSVATFHGLMEVLFRTQSKSHIDIPVSSSNERQTPMWREGLRPDYTSKIFRWRVPYQRVPTVRGAGQARDNPTIPRRKSWRAGVRHLPAALLAQSAAGAAPTEVPPVEDLDMVVLQAGLAVDTRNRLEATLEATRLIIADVKD
ncbi:hypothetical protein PoB_006828500 [Plakobranchus ocellatus]|uniref:Uncharacterized protein n=1 Tax=Plakobranchus ocellatus TaxID=259542 RepID=A0AAV4DCL0_9GAST|nr:hypothetical protein PoB_006828500 [Plakobranchus ocellatus]